jgi:hypothetical protein
MAEMIRWLIARELKMRLHFYLSGDRSSMIIIPSLCLLTAGWFRNRE